MFKTINIRPASSQLLARRRFFHPSPWASNSVADKVTDAADKVNKTVGKKLADAIETGEKVTNKAKEALGSATEETAQKARTVANETSQKARTMADETSEKARSMSNETTQKARSVEADVKDKGEKAMKTGEKIKEDVKEDVKKSW